MQHASPLFAQWDAFVPDKDRVTRSVVPPSSFDSAAPIPWMTWMDASMNHMVLATFVHVPVCCVLPLHLIFSGLVLQGVRIHLWWLFNFPIFRAPTFSPFSPFGV